MIWPDAARGGGTPASWFSHSRAARYARAAVCSSGSRLATGRFARRFSHSLPSLRNEPSAQTILLQVSPSGLKPCSQASGQTRPGLSLMASSASRLASLTLNFVPACLLNSVSERCDAVLHSPSAAPVRQPTRRNSACTDLARSAGDGWGGPAGGSGLSDARLGDARLGELRLGELRLDELRLGEARLGRCVLSNATAPAASASADVSAAAILLSASLPAAGMSAATRRRSASATCSC